MAKTDVVFKIDDTVCATFDSLVDMPLGIGYAIIDNDTGIKSYVALTDDRTHKFATSIKVRPEVFPRDYWIMTDIDPITSDITFRRSEYTIRNAFPNIEDALINKFAYINSQWVLIEVTGDGKDTEQCRINLRTSPDGIVWDTQSTQNINQIEGKDDAYFAETIFVDGTAYMVYRTLAGSTGKFYLIKNTTPLSEGQWEEVSTFDDSTATGFEIDYINEKIYVFFDKDPDSTCLIVSPADGTWEKTTWNTTGIITNNNATLPSMYNRNNTFVCMSGEIDNVDSYFKGNAFPPDTQNPLSFGGNWVFDTSLTSYSCQSYEHATGKMVAGALEDRTTNQWGICVMDTTNALDYRPIGIFEVGKSGTFGNFLNACAKSSSIYAVSATDPGLVFMNGSGDTRTVAYLPWDRILTMAGSANEIICILWSNAREYNIAHKYTFS